jgi:hypothetical protein
MDKFPILMLFSSSHFRQNPRRNDGDRNRENPPTTEVRWIWTAVVKGMIDYSAFPSVYIVYVDTC